MESNITKELLFNHFMGNTSAIQKRMIDEWVLNITNEEFYYKYLEEYESLHPEYSANIDLAIDKYYSFLEQINTNAINESRTISIPKMKWGNQTWVTMAIAASITFILGFTIYFAQDYWEYQTYETAFGETKSFQLSDGSSVALNPNSSLRVPRWGFGEKSRKVFLQGEASFSIKHTPSNQKFIVRTAKKFEVVVLGTEFTVFARDRGAKVILNKGKVQLNFELGKYIKKLMMNPGDLVIIDNQSNTKIKTNTHPEIQEVWKGRRYIFEQTTLQEIIYILEENYGIQTELENKELLNLTLSGTFNANTADELIELVGDVLSLRITRQENKVFIKQSNQ